MLNIVKIVETSQNCQKFSKKCQKLSTSPKIIKKNIKIVKNFKIFKKIQLLSKCQVMLPHHSDEMSHRSQASMTALCMSICKVLSE